MGSVRVVVHLGPMKTGTSAFAAHLSLTSVDGKLPPSIIYPVDELWFPANGPIVKHHDLVEIAPRQLPDGGFRARKTPNSADAVHAKLREIARVARKRAHDVTVILVCEIADQEADAELLGSKLAEIFDQVDFVIVAREQAGAIPSLLGQQVRMWNRKKVTTLRIAPFLRFHRQRNSYDYSYLWDKWSLPNAPYTMHFIPYRSSRSATDDLSQYIFDSLGLGVYPHHEQFNNAARIHPSFSTTGMRLLIAAKKLDKIIGWLPLGEKFAMKVFDRFLGYCHAESRRKLDQFVAWTLPASDRVKVVEAYRASNEEFRTKLGARATTPEWTAWFDKVLPR